MFESCRAHFENRLQSREIFLIRTAHRASHHGRGDLREPRRLAAVSQGHPCRACVGVLPRIGRFHRKRTLIRAHHEPLAWNELSDLVRIREPPSEEPRGEGDLRADRDWFRRFPLDGFDVLVPGRRVGRVRGVLGDLVSRAGDLDCGLNVDPDARALPFRDTFQSCARIPRCRRIAAMVLSSALARAVEAVEALAPPLRLLTVA